VLAHLRANAATEKTGPIPGKSSLGAR
jgi:hypothetical protein